MKVGVYYNNNKVLAEEREIPEINNNEILIKVKACGICGSDLLEWYRIKKAPIVLGHELSGEVIKVGENIKNFKIGDRVFSTHHVPCYNCYYCFNGNETACDYFHKVNNHYPGGFSEYLKVSGKSVENGTFLLPNSMSYEEATFIEPLGTVVRALRTINLKHGESVLILGSGIIGLLMIKLARISGAGLIVATDLHQFRLEAAKKFGANEVFKPEEFSLKKIKEINSNRLFDKVILCTGSISAVETALEAIDKGGTLLFFAVPEPDKEIKIDLNRFWRDDITIKTCYGASPLDNLQAMNLILNSKINVLEMITHRYPLENIGDAFKKAANGNDCLKIIIYPNGL